MSSQPVVCNTSPLLYLGRIGKLTILPALFQPFYVPKQVAFELDVGRSLRADTVNPRQLDWVTMVTVEQTSIDSLPTNQLGAGETAAIAYAYHQAIPLVILDDRQARHFATRLGIQVMGCVGILLEAKQHGLIDMVKPHLQAIQQEGFRLSPMLYQQALQLAKEV